MAHIKKMRDKRRKLPWRVQIRRKGLPTKVKMFATNAEAKLYADEEERHYRLTGLPRTHEALKKHTVADIVRWYLKEFTPEKSSHKSETWVLNNFLKHPLCSKSLAYVSKQDGHNFIRERLKATRNGKPIAPSTVARERTVLRHVFQAATEQFGYESLINPFAGIKIKGSIRKRTRRLEPGELEKLEKAINEKCRALNLYYVPLAIYLTIDTGMRRDEVFSLTWEDIDVCRRRIKIRKSKTDAATGVEGRTIVLPIPALLHLLNLYYALAVSSSLPGAKSVLVRDIRPTGLIFPRSKSAFSQSFYDVRIRANMKDLQFRDLRREAGSRWHEAGLIGDEKALMLGHAKRDVTSTYVSSISSDLASIQTKLDKHHFGYKTHEDIENPISVARLSPLEVIRFRAGYDALKRKLPPDQRKIKADEAIRLWGSEKKELPSEFLVPLPPVASVRKLMRALSGSYDERPKRAWLLRRKRGESTAPRLEAT